MDISEIPELPVSPVSSTRGKQRRRRPLGDRPGGRRPGASREPPRPVDLQLSDEARTYEVLREILSRTLRGFAAGDAEIAALDDRMDRWTDWSPSGAAALMAAEVRPWIAPRRGADRSRDVREAFREGLDQTRRSGVATPAIEAHLRDTLGELIAHLVEAPGSGD